MKNQIILVPSKLMDRNNKRNECGLIRMNEKSRSNLGLSNDKSVELWPNTNTNDRINRNRSLKIYKAYSDDIKHLDELGMSEEEKSRTAFVTLKVFNFICSSRISTSDGKNKDAKENVWIADSIEDTVIGADPEFVLVKDGTFQRASSVPGFNFEGELGSDGPLAEVRPFPEIEIKPFIENIRNIFQNNSQRRVIDEFDWIGGCFFYKNADEHGNAIGGHAHIGTPIQIKHMIDKSSGEFRSGVLTQSVFSCLQKVLDEYISVPMVRVDGKQSSVDRRLHYGGFGDFRTDNGRLEYRTLSGSWLIHPRLAEAVMGSVKAVSDAFFKMAENMEYNIDSFIPEEYIAYHNEYQNDDANQLFDMEYEDWNTIEIVKSMDATKSSIKMIDILNNGNIKFDKAFFSNIKKKFESLSTYNKYREFVDLFLEIIQLPLKELKKIDNNIKHNWLEGKEFIV